mmetsp:Transcript_117227/g.314284  ORF Transcript_117227/g.314284 Transcript_117227/m.314284 type:complete len:236 (+) Transcript_117227:98-805(+)
MGRGLPKSYPHHGLVATSVLLPGAHGLDLRDDLVELVYLVRVNDGALDHRLVVRVRGPAAQNVDVLLRELVRAGHGYLQIQLTRPENLEDTPRTGVHVALRISNHEELTGKAESLFEGGVHEVRPHLLLHHLVLGVLEKREAANPQIHFVGMDPSLQGSNHRVDKGAEILPPAVRHEHVYLPQALPIDHAGVRCASRGSLPDDCLLHDLGARSGSVDLGAQLLLHLPSEALQLSQ